LDSNVKKNKLGFTELPPFVSDIERVLQIIYTFYN